MALDVAAIVVYRIYIKVHVNPTNTAFQTVFGSSKKYERMDIEKFIYFIVESFI